MPITHLPIPLTLIYLTLLIIALSILLFGLSSTYIPILPTTDKYYYRPNTALPTSGEYINDPLNRQLSHEQCMERFPPLYREADRAADYFKGKGGIEKWMVDEAEKQDAAARMIVLDNKLYVKNFYGGINTRAQAAVAAVYRTVLTAPEPIPDVDFVIQIGDAGGGEYPHFVLDRKEEEEHLWLMPDFGFFSWPEPGVGAYTQVRDLALAEEVSLGLNLGLNGSVAESSWENKFGKLIWRGVPMVEVRQDLLRASANQPWSDVRELNWAAINQDEEGREKNNGDLKSLHEHCQYRFLAHVEGWAYSGRLKYLQQCRSVIVTHPLKYIQHYHHLLNPDPADPAQNILEVPLPLEENLPKVMEELLAPENQEWVERIADNNWNDMREGWISPAANECYYRHALRAYASVQNFRPELDGAVPYESFMLMGTVHWNPHR